MHHGDLLLILNVAFHFMELFAEQPAGFEVEHTLVSGSEGTKRVSFREVGAGLELGDVAV